MSYPGSQQQFGHSDLRILQQQLMLARLQELQKQQQLGQFGDGKPSSALNNMSLLAKHATGGQIPNLGSATPFQASNMVSSSNLNWMHHNVSSSMQGRTGGTTYPHGEGLMMNSAMLQPDNSLYGTPIAGGLGNLGQYSSMHGVSHSSVNMLSINSDEKPSSQVQVPDNSFFGNQHPVLVGHGHSVDGSFMLRQGLQEKSSVPQASVRLLNSGISPGSFPHMNKLTLPSENNRTGGQPGATRFLREQYRQTNDSRGTATLDPLEEKILFDTEDSGWGTSLSKLAAIDSAEFVGASSCNVSMNAFSSIQSGSWSALMQSAVAEASSSDTGIQEELSGLSFQNTDSSIVKNPSSLVSSEHQQIKQADCLQHKDASQWSEFQQLPNGPVPAGHPTDDCVGLDVNRSRDLFHGSRTMSGMRRNDYQFIRQAADSHSYLHAKEDTNQKDYETIGYNNLSNSNPMAVDALYKRAAEIHGSQNHYQGENSYDSYNSKVSQVYVAQGDHTFLNAEDSESSARSSHRPQNQGICITSPGAKSHPQTTDTFLTTTNFMIKGKSNLSAEAFSKGSPASDMSASFDSQSAPEHNNANQLRDHRSTEQSGFNINQTGSQESDMPNISICKGTSIPDRFSFHSSVPGDSSLIGLGNGQKSQTWWTPSSSGHPFPPFRGASLSQNCSSSSNAFLKTEMETLNLKSEKISFEGLSSGLLNMNNQLDGEHTLRVSESINKTFAKGQQISLSGVSPSQDVNTLKDESSCHDYASLGALSSTQSAVIQGTYDKGVKPHNVWMDVPSQKDVTGLSSPLGLPSRSSALSKDNFDDKRGQVYEPVDLLKVHESTEKYPTVSTDASTSIESFMNQQGYDNSGLVKRNSCGTTFRAVSSYSQPQPLPNVDNVTQQAQIAGTELNSVASNLSALSNLNKQWIPVVPGQQPLHEMHNLAQNHVGSQLNSCSPPAALQYIYSHKPVFSQGHFNSNTLSDRLRQFNGSAAHSSILASENVQLNGSVTHFNGIDASRKYGLLPGLANQMVKSEQSLLSSVLPPDANVNLIASRTKKRKTAMYDCLPWHKEVMKTCQALPDISTADQEWAEATNRLIEKCVDGGERNEEIQSAVRAKRRLITTTKLMQLVFRPPPRRVYSVNVYMDYETVAYFITKFALADACSWANRKIDCNMVKNDKNVHHLSDKATELVEKMKDMETNIERLSKSVSAVDVLVECQELEKFSVINHFAKYHSRGLGSATTDSASSSTGVTSVRPFLQRYVSAVPLPPKLPEGVHCLSL